MSKFLDLINRTDFDFIFLLRDNEYTLFGERKEIKEILENEQNETKILYITNDTEIYKKRNMVEIIQ